MDFLALPGLIYTAVPDGSVRPDTIIEHQQKQYNIELPWRSVTRLFNL